MERMSITPKTLGIILILVFGISFFSIQYNKIEKPKEYIRKDYLLSLSNDTGIVKINCFDFPAVPFSTFFLYRIKETEGKILLKKDFLVCDLDYKDFKVGSLESVELWLTNDAANYVETRELNLNATTQQIMFPLTVSGNYRLEAMVLKNVHSGWGNPIFPEIVFYVYDSTDSYFSEKNSYEVSIINIFLTIVGVLLGFIALLSPMKSNKRNKIESCLLFFI